MGKLKYYLYATATIAVFGGALSILDPVYGKGRNIGPPGGLGVNIMNTPLTREIFQARRAALPDAQGMFSLQFDAVPDGVVLVIEHVSVFIRLWPDTARATQCEIQTPQAQGGNIVNHTFPALEVGSNIPGGSAAFVCSESVRLYAESGVGIWLWAGSTDGGTIQEVIGNISGYFLPVESPTLSP